MKAIILAAGMGKRLKCEAPKPLTILRDNKSIIDFAVENISEYISVNDIIVVVGYKKEMIIDQKPNLAFVYNENYANTNTSKSLLKALNRINEDVLFLNGDIYFDKRIIKKLIEHNCSCALVDNKRCGEEEVKFITSKDGYIRRISKQVREAEGESLGINYIKKTDLETFRKYLYLADDQDYFEKAIEDMIIKDNVKILPVNTDGLFCHEIDFIEDLNFVKKSF